MHGLLDTENILSTNSTLGHFDPLKIVNHYEMDVTFTKKSGESQTSFCILLAGNYFPDLFGKSPILNLATVGSRLSSWLKPIFISLTNREVLFCAFDKKLACSCFSEFHDFRRRTSIFRFAWKLVWNRQLWKQVWILVPSLPCDNSLSPPRFVFMHLNWIYFKKNGEKMYLQESVFNRRCTKICLFSAAQSNDKEMGRGRCIDDRSHHLLLGRLSPLWIPDEDAEECMMCR